MFVRGPQHGNLPYQKLTVPEHSSPGTVVGNITRAVDADEGSNAIVYYFIAGDTVSYRHSDKSCHDMLLILMSVM